MKSYGPFINCIIQIYWWGGGVRPSYCIDGWLEQLEYQLAVSIRVITVPSVVTL